MGSDKEENRAVLREDLSRLGGVRVFFGHQSVGQNILDGLEDLLDTGAPELKVVKIGSGGGIPAGPCLAHAFIGENLRPAEKVRAFEEFLDRAPTPWDAALMKFCYLDVTNKTNVSELFRTYRDAVDRIRRKHPGLVLVHATVPLTRESGWRVLLKRLLGRPSARDDNVKRSEYNRLLLREFGMAPLFDISRLESERPGGSREEFHRDGAAYPGLAPEYTADGGHLNGTGGRRLARGLVHALAEALKEKGSRDE